MNKVILMGRLTRDPEIRVTQSGMAVARMTIAVNRRTGKDKEQTADFISLIAWDKVAEIAEKYLAKGRQILVEGRIQTGSYEKGGQKHYTTNVVCERIEFADSRQQNTGAGTTPQTGDAPPWGEVDDNVPF